MTLLTLSFWVHLLDDGHFFPAIEAIGCQKFQLTRWLHGLIIAAELDLVDFLSELVNAILDLLDLVEVIFLALLCQFFKLGSLFPAQFVAPLDAQVLSDLSLAQVRHSLLNFVELLVFEELIGGQDLFFRWNEALRLNLVFEFLVSNVLRFGQDRLGQFC